MNTPSKSSSTPRRFSDLVEVYGDGSTRLMEGVHPVRELLDMEVEEVLATFKRNQVEDFTRVIDEMESADNPLHDMFAELHRIAEQQGDTRFGNTALFQSGELKRLFLDLHEHVMGHPVWRHPLFLRIFRGEFELEHLKRFALQYFNQVKNTRQCVALALGRFSGVMPMPYGVLNERLSEMTQIVLAQLIADEYGVGTHEIEDYPTLGGLFQSHTHIVMYRQLFEGLEIPFPEQDVPMLHGVADNVLTQRLVAGDEAFAPLEALSSVGLGMEWGVPEFFSLLLGGMIRFAHQNDVPLTRHHLLVFIAHVQYDVLHAIAVMMVTSFYIEDEASVDRIKGATNTLMASRYAMMSEVYTHVFGDACHRLDEIGLASRYHLRDRRIEEALRRERAKVAEGRVMDAAVYRDKREVPFVFADGV